YGICDADKIETLRDELYKELAAIVKDGLSGSELRKVKRQLTTAHLYSLETNTGKANTLGYSFALLGNPDLLDKYTDAVAAVSEEEVIDTIRGMSPTTGSLFVARPRE